jgi:hypothetical protein
MSGLGREAAERASFRLEDEHAMFVTLERMELFRTRFRAG